MRKIISSILIDVLVLSLAIFFNGGQVAKAADTQLNQTITAGTKSVQAPASVDFSAVNYSFSEQTSTTSLDNIQPKDETGSGAGWTLDITAENWTSGANTMYYASSTDGELTINQDSVSISKTVGQAIDPTYGPIEGSTDTFSTATTTITIMSADAGYGAGEYDADGYEFQQLIPGLTEAGDWNSTTTVSFQ